MARNVPYIERPIKVKAITNSIHLGSWQLLSGPSKSSGLPRHECPLRCFKECLFRLHWEELKPDHRYKFPFVMINITIIPLYTFTSPTW